MIPTMHALELTHYGHPTECFSYNEHAPKPMIQSPYHVLVRVKAAGTNPVDVKIALGSFKLSSLSPLPNIIGADFAGLVEQKGDLVDEFEIGDAVFGSLHMPYSACGSYAEYTVVDIRRDSIAKKPDQLSFEQASSAGIAVLTAYQGIVHSQKETGYPPRPRKILVVGASGGVGAYAVQLAKALHPQNQVIGICSGKNVSFVKQMGADRVVEYTDSIGFSQFLEERGTLDLVFDCVGGERYYELLDSLLNDQGIYCTAVGPQDHSEANKHTIFSAISMSSKLVYKLCFAPHAYSMVVALPHHDFRSRIAPLFESGALGGMVQDEKTNIIPLKEGYKAHEKLMTHRTVGKIVLSVE